MTRLARATAVTAFYLSLSVAFCSPLFAQPNALGVADWDQHLFYYGSVLKSLVEYGQLPFWNPWYCGGNVLWQNPQIALLSPAYPLAGFMSLALAMKINIVAHYFVGLAGMHLLLRRLGLSFFPLVAFLGSVFVLSGALVLHLAVGHSVFLPAFYLPLQLFLFLRAVESRQIRDAMGSGAVLALMVWEGGLHVVPMATVTMGLSALFVAAGRRDWRPVALATIALAASVAYSAPKLVPVAEFVGSNRFTDTRGVLDEPDRMGADMLWHAYLDPGPIIGTPFAGQLHRWHEYGNYVGWAGAFAIAGGLLWALLGGRAPDRWLGASLAATAVVLLVVSAGEFGPWAPASLLKRLPLFSSYRVPSRYTIVFTLVGVATAGWAARGLQAQLRGRAGLVVALLLALAIGELGWSNHRVFERVFQFAPVEQGFGLMQGPRVLVNDPDPDPYASGSKMFRALMRDEAFYYCYEPLQLRHGAVLDAPLVVSDGHARIFRTDFTPNRVEFAVLTGAEPSRVSLNQNMAEGWRSTAGDVAPDASGRPSVLLPAGAGGTFAFTFVPPGLGIGFALLALGLAAVPWLWRRRLG